MTKVLLAALVLGAALYPVLRDSHPPIFRWGYTVMATSGRGQGKPGRAY